MAFWMKWHRRIGLYVAAVLAMLAVTGILINHSQDMHWHETPVYSKTIGALYGVKPAPVVAGYQVDQIWISQTNLQIHFGSTGVFECPDSLKGAIGWDSTIAVLCGSRVILLTPSGELVETLPELPANVRLGLSQPPFGALAVAFHPSVCDESFPCYYLDEEVWDWAQLPPDATVSWAVSQSLPIELSDELNRNQPLPGITMERLMLDLHSGRLFGRVGVWVVDLSGVLLLMLVLSGVATRIMKSLRKRR